MIFNRRNLNLIIVYSIQITQQQIKIFLLNEITASNKGGLLIKPFILDHN